jgi:hypothetical protein
MFASFVLGWANGFLFGLLLPFLFDHTSFEWRPWLLVPALGMVASPVIPLLITAAVAFVTVPSKITLPLLVFVTATLLTLRPLTHVNLLE